MNTATLDKPVSTAPAQLQAAPPQLKNILVAIDFSDYSAAALRYAVFLARNFGAGLTLVHVTESYIYPEDLAAGYTIDELDARWVHGREEKLEELRQALKKEMPAETVVVTGPPWTQIVAIAKSRQADLIVLGTHGRTGLKHAVMGSTAERVAQHAACPVLVVHLPGSNDK
jgi:nucleotide-binding universal stress UspA family protein